MIDDSDQGHIIEDSKYTIHDLLSSITTVEHKKNQFQKFGMCTIPRKTIIRVALL